MMMWTLTQTLRAGEQSCTRHLTPRVYSTSMRQTQPPSAAFAANSSVCSNFALQHKPTTSLHDKEWGDICLYKTSLALVVTRMIVALSTSMLAVCLAFMVYSGYSLCCTASSCWSCTLLLYGTVPARLSSARRTAVHTSAIHIWMHTTSQEPTAVAAARFYTW